MNLAAIAALAALLTLAAAGPALAFCGFYVAQADAKLFNKSSKVVLARAGNTTAITMASDYEGEPREFALVIPVPTFIERKQIGVVDMKTVDHLDAYTSPGRNAPGQRRGRSRDGGAAEPHVVAMYLDAVHRALPH